ncbi:TerD family protein [Streptomyces sp. PmtA]|uniref:TerD family protein n=1 Tax=Streptomyces sp. PmtA TaxID=3074275 RepID=UPI0030157538
MSRRDAMWWQRLPEMDVQEALDVEASLGFGDRFAAVDAVLGRLLGQSLRGEAVAVVTPAARSGEADQVGIKGLTDAQARWAGGFYGVAEQQQRGAWYLPERVSLKAGTVNLPHLLRHRPAHALTLAGDDVARVFLTDGATDAVLLWSLLVPLFDTLMEPVRMRATGPTGSVEEQLQLWETVENRYRLLGIGAGALDMFQFQGGWHRLDRKAQQRARVELVDVLADTDPIRLAARHRMTQLQALMGAFAKKAKSGTPLARRVLTRALQPVLSAYFQGDWLAALDYLQAQCHPDEEIITTLPEPRLFVGLAAEADRVAAQEGIAAEEMQAMLAAFLGGSTSLSPVEERPAALRRWWEAFDAVHAVQATGMRPLWGLIDEGIVTPSERGPIPRLYRELLPGKVTGDVDRLWERVTLPRYPERLVGNPHPHQLMAAAFGPAAELWHGVALTAWYVCEGPYSRSSLSFLSRKYGPQLAALSAAGTPVDPALFKELVAAEALLGPEEERHLSRHESQVDTDIGTFTMTTSYGSWIRRDGFEYLRDIVTRHRRAWADTYLDNYLRGRWHSELEAVAHAYHRTVAAKGRPPTLKQFAQFAAQAANHWCGGDLGALYTAIGEPAPAVQQRPDRFADQDAFTIASQVYQALGGTPMREDQAVHQPEEARRNWELSRLASESLRYIQLHEALGEPPSPRQFGATRLPWPWPGGESEGWPLYQQIIASLGDAAASLPAQDTEQPAGLDVPHAGAEHAVPMAKGANTSLSTEPVKVHITAHGAPVDVSALLLNPGRTVRSASDLVFYNHPCQDGVEASAHTVTATLEHLPGDVHAVMVVVSIDLEAEPASVFDHRNTWEATIVQDGHTWQFQPPRFTSNETVAVAVEIYRRAQGWKIRAIGQGYDTGLAGLATDYGITVDS